MVDDPTEAVNIAVSAGAPVTGIDILINEVEGLTKFFAATGKLFLSVDAAGSNAASHVAEVEKPNTAATVRAAFVMAASLSGRVIADGDVAINGTPISWDAEFFNDIPPFFPNFYHNVRADVTSIVKPVVDAASPGRIPFTFTEINTGGIDGEILVVVFDDPTQTKNNTIILLFGGQALAGDTFAITLAEPIDPADTNARADMGLGISFGFQGSGQFSIVEVNAQRLTTSAGGQDDGIATNGALITVGGLDDSNTNPPDPLATPSGDPRIDDELYTLLPFISATDTSISVFTQNPSNDDNIFFAYFKLSAAAVIGESILVTPTSATNKVGTTHTVTAKVVNDTGASVPDRLVTFHIIAGPNAGDTATISTNANGEASFTYAGDGGIGIDEIQASFVNPTTGEEIVSDVVTKRWITAEAILLTPTSATNRVGTTHTVTARVHDDDGNAVPGRVVTFRVISGPNSGDTGTNTTNTSGEASFTYTGNGGKGTDRIQASFVNPSTGETLASNIVTKGWGLLVGDIDGDGDRDADDARRILEVLVEAQTADTPPAIHFSAAGNLNADSVINNIDPILLLAAFVAAPPKTPAPPDNTRITIIDNHDGSITVIGSAGAVPGGSTVKITNTTNGDTTTVTAAPDGSFNAQIDSAGGENTIVVEADGGPAKIAETVTIPDSGIRGLVTDSTTGEPLVGLSVLAYNFDSGAFIAQATTSDLGVYFLGVPPGRYNVVALGTGQLATQWSGNAANFDVAVPVTVGSIAEDVDFALNPGGTVTGQVTGPDGNPVAGQLVVFLDTETGDLVAIDRTEADGRFSRGLAPRRYKVRVDGEASGLGTTYFANAPVTSAATPVEVTLDDITADVNVQLVQGGRMLGRVTEAETGNPVNDALVIVDDIPRGFVDVTTTDEDGNYVLSLAPGSYRVRVRAAGTDLAPQYHKIVGNLPVANASTPVTITADEDTTNVDFSLAVGGKITGQVVSAVDGTPLAGVSITASEFSSFAFVDNTSTRFDGTYMLNLPPGDYKLRAVPTGTNFAVLAFGDINERSRSISVPVEIGSITPSIDFHLPIGGIISGRVTSDGVGIPSVEVDFTDLSTSFIGGTSSQFDGSYRLALKAPRDYRVNPFTGTPIFVNLARDNRTAPVVSLTPGVEVPNVDFNLGSDATIAGRVTAADDDRPLPRAVIDAFEAATGTFVAGASANFDGTYKIALPAGSYNLRVAPLGHPLPWQWFEASGNPVYNRFEASVVTVGTGEEATADVSVAPGGSISGRLTSLDDGAPVSAAQVRLSGVNTGTFGLFSVRADGTYTAYGPPDDYRVEAQTSNDTPFVREFFDDRPDFGSADLVSITGVGVDTPNIDFELALNFNPRGIAVAPDGAFAYVANFGANNVSLVDLTTMHVVQRIPVGDSPIEVALTPNPHRLYVSNFNGDTISVIDTTTNQVINTTLTNLEPVGIVFTSDGSRAYVGHNEFNDVIVIETATNSIVQAIPLEAFGPLLAITPDDQFIYVPTFATDAVSVIATATNTVVATIPVGDIPVGIAIPLPGNFVYVGNRGDSTVSVIDRTTNTVVQTIPLGGIDPRRVAASPDGSIVLTANEDTNNVSIIDTTSNTEVAVVPVGLRPIHIAFSPDSSKAYITNNGDNTISVIDLASRSVTDTIELFTDDDGDGIRDGFEVIHGLNPNDPSDAAQDPDGDGLSNLKEFQANTDPNNSDTDGDGVLDGAEVALGTDPLSHTSFPPTLAFTAPTSGDVVGIDGGVGFLIAINSAGAVVPEFASEDNEIDVPEVGRGANVNTTGESVAPGFVVMTTATGENNLANLFQMTGLGKQTDTTVWFVDTPELGVETEVTATAFLVDGDLDTLVGITEDQPPSGLSPGDQVHGLLAGVDVTRRVLSQVASITFTPSPSAVVSTTPFVEITAPLNGDTVGQGDGTGFVVTINVSGVVGVMPEFVLPIESPTLTPGANVDAEGNSVLPGLVVLSTTTEVSVDGRNMDLDEDGEATDTNLANLFQMTGVGSAFATTAWFLDAPILRGTTLQAFVTDAAIDSVDTFIDEDESGDLSQGDTIIGTRGQGEDRETVNATVLSNVATITLGRKLYGSSSTQGTNPGSLFLIDTTTGVATLIGTPENTPNGLSDVSFDPFTGILYAMHGAAVRGAELLTLDPNTGAVLSRVNVTNPFRSMAGSDALAFDLAGTLFAGAWAQGRLLTVNPDTGVVLSDIDVTGSGGNNHLADLAVDPTTGALWATRGNSSGGNRRLLIVDPNTGAAIFLLDPIFPDGIGRPVTAIAFDNAGTLFASVDGDRLATIDKNTGEVTFIGTGFGGPKIAGLGFQR